MIKEKRSILHNKCIGSNENAKSWNSSWKQRSADVKVLLEVIEIDLIFSWKAYARIESLFLPVSNE